MRFLEAMLFQRALDQRMLNLQRQGRIGFYGTAKGQEGATLGTGAAFERRRLGLPGAARGRDRALARHAARALRRAVLRQRDGPDARPPDAVPLQRRPPPLRLAVLAHRDAGHAGRGRGARGADPRRRRSWSAATWATARRARPTSTRGSTSRRVWKAPVVFVCQNNQWAISRARREADGLARRSRSRPSAYGMPGLRVDGNDVLACYVAAKAAVDRARARRGPDLRRVPHLPPGRPLLVGRPDEVPRRARGRRCGRRRTRCCATAPGSSARGEWDDAREEAFLAEAGQAHHGRDRRRRGGAPPRRSRRSSRTSTRRSRPTSPTSAPPASGGDAGLTASKPARPGPVERIAAPRWRPRHGERDVRPRGDRRRSRRLRRGDPRRAAGPQDGRRRARPHRRRVPELRLHPVARA